MAPWDQWWNRNFPPYSWKRLGFLLACMPFVSVFVGFTRTFTDGDEFSWTGVIVTTLMGWTLLPLMWMHIRNTKMDEQAAPEWTPPTTPDKPPIPHPIPGRDEELSEIQREALTGLRARRAAPPRFDFLYAFAIAFFGMLAVMALMGSNPLEPLTFVMTGAMSLFFVVVIRFRYSVWSVVLVSAVVALPCAIFLQLFLFWFGNDDSFWSTWAFCAAFIFVMAMPFWWRFRETRHHPLIGRMPLWIISAGGTVMLLIVVVAVAFTDTDMPSDRPAARSVDQVPVQQDDTYFGASTKEEAALRLYFAWRSGSREIARKVAHESAVDDLFSRPFDPVSTTRGCGVDSNGFSRCVIAVSDGLILLAPQMYSNGKQYIDYIERVPVDFPITYSDQSPPSMLATPATDPIEADQ